MIKAKQEFIMKPNSLYANELLFFYRFYIMSEEDKESVLNEYETRLAWAVMICN